VIIADQQEGTQAVPGGRLVVPVDADLHLISASGSPGGNFGESVGSAAVMGHPATGIARRSSKRAPLGGGLKTGKIVLSGSFTRPADIRPGGVIHVDYGPLGSIGVSFS